MSEILDNIYIDRFLLLAFVKYILSQIHSHCIWNCTFWRSRKFLFFEESIFKVFLYLCCFFYSKTINFHNSGIVGNALSIGLQYTQNSRLVYEIFLFTVTHLLFEPVQVSAGVQINP